jgi:tetratricopeptide (TPR) repeat protein
MSKQTRRIAVIAVSGTLIVAVAWAVRAQIGARRMAAQRAASLVQQSAAEQELVRMHDKARAEPRNKQAQWDLVNFFLKYNMLDKAADQLAFIVRLDHTDLDAKLKLADVCLAANDYHDAEYYYREATKQSPKNSVTWQCLCSPLIKERKYFEAAAAANQAMILDKNDIGSRFLHAVALSNFVMQYQYPLSHKRELNLAQRELSSLAKEMPDNGDLFYQYGRVERALLHRDASIEQLERAHMLSPKNADVSRLLATSYHEIQKDNTALKLLEEAASYQSDDPGVNDLLGRILLGSTDPGSHERALDAFQKALKAAPHDARITEHLGSAYDELNNLPDARLAYERSTQLDPYRSSPFHKLALLYTRIGEPKLAKQAALLAEHVEFNEQQLIRVMHMSATHPEDVNLHLILADRYRDMKLTRQARDEYFLVLKLDPNNKQVPRKFPASADVDMRQ